VKAGHTSTAHGPNARSVSATQAAPASGSIHRNVPDCPKCPKVRGEDELPVQWGDLESRISKPRPQSLGFWCPYPGRTPFVPGYCTVIASATVRGSSSRGACTSAANRTRSSTVETPSFAGEPSRVVDVIPSGSSTACFRYSAKGISVAFAM
jgi:hypothetical protein